jgi:hypothetical protein
MFTVMICITSLSEWHYLICIIDEITDILNIRVFRVKPKPTPQPTKVQDAKPLIK